MSLKRSPREVTGASRHRGPAIWRPPPASCKSRGYEGQRRPQQTSATAARECPRFTGDARPLPRPPLTPIGCPVKPRPGAALGGAAAVGAVTWLWGPFPPPSDAPGSGKAEGAPGAPGAPGRAGWLRCVAPASSPCPLMAHITINQYLQQVSKIFSFIILNWSVGPVWVWFSLP